MFGLLRGWGQNGKMTQDLPWFGQWGLRPPSFFLLIIGPHYNRVRRPFHRLHGNRERAIQIIGPNLNGLGLKNQWIGLLGPNII